VALHRDLIVPKAREYVAANTPFHQQGRVKGRGLDCVGIVLCVGEDLGLRYKHGGLIKRFDYMDYGLFPVLDQMQAEAEKIFVKKSVESMIPGDILTMRAPFLVHHMAIVSQLQQGFGIIHAYGAVGKVTEHLLDARWAARIAGVFTYSGVDD
jgi:hypothetical protein